jgi:hypothetical protein
MITSTAMNSVMQFAFAICLLYCLGDYDTVSSAPLPLVEIYYGACVCNPLHTAVSVLTESLQNQVQGRRNNLGPYAWHNRLDLAPQHLCLGVAFSMGFCA